MMTFLTLGAVATGLIGGPGSVVAEWAKAPEVVASWYGAEFQGRLTASGEVFDKNDPKMAAHKSLPFGTEVVLLNPENLRMIQVEIQDRGPFVRGRDFDLSKAGASVLGFKDDGKATLRVISIKEPEK